MNSNQKVPVPVILAFVSIIIAAAGFFMVASDQSDDFTLMLIGLAGMAVTLPAVYFMDKKARAAHQKVMQEEAAQKMKRDFYDKCQKYHITTIKTAEDRAKAAAIAESLNCPPEIMADLGKYLEEIKKERQKSHEAAHQAVLDEERKKEQALHATLTQYAGYTGKEKRIAMLEAERAAYLQKASGYRGVSNTAMSVGQQKEIDWATRGGIASGLAGGAAGVAAAVDAQIKNAQIRANNEAARAAMAPVMFEAMKKQGIYEELAEKTLGHIEQTKTKILNPTAKEDVLKKISFINPEITVSSTGAISIKVSAYTPQPVLILGSENGVIDGTVLAEIYQGNQPVGEAELVLPLWGIDTRSERLEGICLTGGQKGKDYRVVYKAKHLWEMEK